MQNSTPPARRCLITGTTGYLGGRVKAAMLHHGWSVTELTRRLPQGSSSIAFQLGDDVSPDLLLGAAALVHCAYDFKALRWEEIRAKNIAGSEKLFRTAREAKVGHLIYISSISAFEGCRSLYGKAKLETERVALSFGATVIRPGLVWGEIAGAMFGKLMDQVEGAKVLPLIGGGRQSQYLVHEQDLCEFICRCAEGKVSAPAAPVTIAHEQPWEFRALLSEIARSKNKRPAFVPVPWRLVWFALKMAELCRVPINFRSDSLVSLMYQNPAPAFQAQKDLGLAPRPFRLRPA